MKSPVRRGVGKEYRAARGVSERHGYRDGFTATEVLLEDLALQFSLAAHTLSCTCRIASVVNPRLRAEGVDNLRVADANVMSHILSGNATAASTVIGEKAAEMVADGHGGRLAEFVGSSAER